MSEGALVSLMALLGWMVLVGSALNARRIGVRRTMVLALTWLAIFGTVAGIFWAVRG